MTKPTANELAITATTLEYLIASMIEHEPYAVHTIAAFEETLGNIPNEDDIDEVHG